MDYYAGLDVSLELTSVCIVDKDGKIIRETKVASEPAALAALFAGLGLPLTRIGLEASPLSEWLHEGLTAAGHEVVLLETRHVKAALTFTTAIDEPTRFSSSRAVGAHLGLTPRKYQSGETDVTGGISKAGDAMARTALYDAAVALLYKARPSALKAWALAVARRRGAKRALVALARKLATVLHRMWISGEVFRWRMENDPAPVAAAAA